MRMDALRIVDAIARHEFGCAHRVAHCCQSRDLALVTHALESQRLGSPAVHLAEAVFFGRRQSHVFAAVEGRERAVGKMTMAVMHRVATSVRRNEQSVLPRTVEKGGKGV